MVEIMVASIPPKPSVAERMQMRRELARMRAEGVDPSEVARVRLAENRNALREMQEGVTRTLTQRCEAISKAREALTKEDFNGEALKVLESQLDLISKTHKELKKFQDTLKANLANSQAVLNEKHQSITRLSEELQTLRDKSRQTSNSHLKNELFRLASNIFNSTTQHGGTND